MGKLFLSKHLPLFKSVNYCRLFPCPQSYTLYFILCHFSASDLQRDPINSLHTDATKLLWVVCSTFFLINGINEKMHLDSSGRLSTLQGNFTAERTCSNPRQTLWCFSVTRLRHRKSERNIYTLKYIFKVDLNSTWKLPELLAGE